MMVKEFALVVDKLLDSVLSEHRLRLARYNRELHEFEQRFGMDSATLHARFEAGEAGDAMDYFEWASLYELKQDLLQKIHRLEIAQ
ncbi:MAG: hypothetical protein R3E79_37645 [Caldilineaceae bacterium]